MTTKHSPAPQKVTRILLVEDQALVRDSLAFLLNGSESLQVVKSVATTRQALHYLDEWQPVDMVVTDFNLKGETALDLLLALRSSAMPVVVLTSLFNAAAMQPSISAGAKGFIFKECELSEFILALKQVADGGIYCATPLSLNEQEPDLQLTQAEKLTLTWLATGMSNKQIAKVLGKSNETVKSQVASLLKKMKCNSRTEVITKARLLNLLDPVAGIDG